MTGDLPDDFLQVTEPQARADSKPAAKMAANPAFEPEVGGLVDLGEAAPAPMAAAVNNGASVSPARKVSSDVPNPPAGDVSTEKKSPRKLLSTEEQDHAMALALQEQLNMEEAEAMAAHQAGYRGLNTVGHTVAAPANMVGRLTVTVVEAKLAKNYGLSRMDPYCRVRVGHSVYETPTCANGSKEPKWNKTFNCYLLQGIKTMDLEIYDECTFQQDALIAYGSFPIPESVTVSHEVVDEWFSLSGNEGPGKEGMIHIIVSLQPIAPGQPLAVPPQVRVAPNVSGGKNMTYQTQPANPQGQQQPQPPPKFSDEEMEEFVKMFPNLDKDIILSVCESCRGNKEAVVNNLLQLGQQ